MRMLIAADVDPGFVTRAQADPRFTVRVQPTKSEETLVSTIGDAEVLVTRAHNRVTRRVFDAAPDLRLIAQGTSGTDNIDAVAARERGIPILSLPGSNANAVAELVIGYLIALTRTVPFYTREVREGRWNRDDCATRHELAHFRLGIVGLGQVGMRVARLARAFGMSVVAYDPYITDDDFRARHADPVTSLDALLEAADILTLHVPLTDETRMMIDAAEIARLRPGSYLVNASRGEVLDTQAALDALTRNHLAGLALDVFDPEPTTLTFPDDPRLILTPHVGGCSREAKSAIGELLYAKVDEWMKR